MSVAKRKQTGKWQARVRDRRGKQVTKSFARKVDAERWEAETKAQIARDGFTDHRHG